MCLSILFTMPFNSDNIDKGFYKKSTTTRDPWKSYLQHAASCHFLPSLCGDLLLRLKID